VRKQVLPESSENRASQPGQIDVATVGTVLITSEATGYPANNIFDGRHGPGASRWVAAEDGEQTLVLAFDAPQTITHVELEIEETEVDRSQELLLSVSCDGGRTYREVVRQGFNFSPPGTTFEREGWAVRLDGVTHLRLRLWPDRGGKPARASITSLTLS
jgi:hypothetical protein